MGIRSDNVATNKETETGAARESATCGQAFKSLMDGKMHTCTRTDERHRKFGTPHMAVTEQGHIVFGPLIKGGSILSADMKAMSFMRCD